MLQYQRFACRSAAQEFDLWIRANPVPRRGLQHAAEVKHLKSAVHDDTGTECSGEGSHAFMTLSSGCKLKGVVLQIEQSEAGCASKLKPNKQQTYLWRDTAEVLRQCIQHAPQGSWTHHERGFTCCNASTGVRSSYTICLESTAFASSFSDLLWPCYCCCLKAPLQRPVKLSTLPALSGISV